MTIDEDKTTSDNIKPLAITKASGATPPSLHFANRIKIDKVSPEFFQMVQDNDEEPWFKMQVWVLHFLIRDFKEFDGAIVDDHEPKVFKACLLEDG